MRIATFAAAVAFMVSAPVMAAPTPTVQADPRAHRADTRLDRNVHTRLAARATTPLAKSEKIDDGTTALIVLLVGGAGIGAAVGLSGGGSPPSP